MLFKPCLQCALKRHLAAVLQGERQPPQRLVQMAVDGLAAASVLFGELRSRLFACAISCQSSSFCRRLPPSKRLPQSWHL